MQRFDEEPRLYVSVRYKYDLDIPVTRAGFCGDWLRRDLYPRP